MLLPAAALDLGKVRRTRLSVCLAALPSPSSSTDCLSPCLALPALLLFASLASSSRANALLALLLMMLKVCSSHVVGSAICMGIRDSVAMPVGWLHDRVPPIFLLVRCALLFHATCCLLDGEIMWRRKLDSGRKIKVRKERD